MTANKNWQGIIGRSFLPTEFDNYCRGLRWDGWRPSFIVLHNTAIPSLDDRPKGFTAQHMKDLEVYYRDIMKWKAGPHLFIDDKKIWVFTPLTVPGTHSPSWNRVSMGVEMLGDYHTESFSKGRGLKVRENTIAALAALCPALNIDPNCLRLHKEDHLTTHLCPGKNVNKDDMVRRVKQYMVAELERSTDKPITTTR